MDTLEARNQDHDKYDSNNGADLDEISDDLIDSMPEPSEHAINQHDNESVNQQKIDSQGETFNPEVHVLKNDEPVVNADGTFRKRPKRSKPRSKLGSIQQEEIPPPDPFAPSGKAAAHLLMTCGVTFGGDEWRPVKNEQYGVDEQSTLENAFTDYFRSTGMTDIPPGWALSIAVGGYVLPRFSMPRTQSRFKKLGYWCHEKWSNLKNRRKRKIRRDDLADAA